MKTMSLDDMVTITNEIFDRYIEPVALSLMSGEVPNTTFAIHRTGTKDNDWLAKVRFKNTLTISVFRCDIYFDDVLRLCRNCKMYLVTPEVFRVAVTFMILHPLYQTQYMDFTTNVNTDYDSMMAGAGSAAYRFMQEHFKISHSIENDILDTLYYYSMIFTNCFKYAPKDHKVIDLLEDLNNKYVYYMNMYYKDAYRSAKYFKSYTNMVGPDGFIILEPKTKGDVRYVGKDETEEYERKTGPSTSQ